MELFHIEPGLMIWTWISFAVLFLIMYKFVFPTLLGNIREREEQISNAVDDAEIIKKTREDIANERAAVIKKAQLDGDEILRRTREDAEALKKNLAGKAELNATEIIEEARKKGDEEKIIALQLLKKDLAAFVCETSEKIIGRSFTTEEDQKWTRELADQL